MFYRLPPAGHPVITRTDTTPVAELFAPYRACWLASGTAALAVAVEIAVRRKGVAHPRVILPAYGCPDLVSAVRFAGAEPVPVDIEAGRPWLDLAQAAAALDENTVAIIAASLLGIPERMEALAELAHGSSVLLIEDSAQAFPRTHDPDFWRGDLVVLSFGRGKPVNLLGGGAVLTRDGRLAKQLPVQEPQSVNSGFRLKATLYNRLLSPRLYWIPQSLPFLHLGETRYHPLASVRAMDAARLACLPAAVTAYRRQDMTVQATVAELAQALAAGEGQVTDLPAACGMPADRRLLRYPLLIGEEERGRLLHRLQRAGLGASCMYPQALPDIPGMPPLPAACDCPQARSFARQLLTLPVYGWLPGDAIERLRDYLV